MRISHTFRSRFFVGYNNLVLSTKKRWTLYVSAKINAWIHLGMHSFYFIFEIFLGATSCTPKIHVGAMFWRYFYKKNEKIGIWLNSMHIGWGIWWKLKMRCAWRWGEAPLKDERFENVPTLNLWNTLNIFWKFKDASNCTQTTSFAWKKICVAPSTRYSKSHRSYINSVVKHS